MAMSLDIREWPGECSGVECVVSREYMAVDARWKGGDGVEASEPYGGVATWRELRARVRFPSMVY